MPKSTDLIAYELEMIEKRLALIEQMLYNRGNNGTGNQEVLALLMNIIKDQMVARPAPVAATPVIAVTTTTPVTSTEDTKGPVAASEKDETVLDPVSSFARRRTFGL